MSRILGRCLVDSRIAAQTRISGIAKRTGIELGLEKVNDDQPQRGERAMERQCHSFNDSAALADDLGDKCQPKVQFRRQPLTHQTVCPQKRRTTIRNNGEIPRYLTPPLSLTHTHGCPLCRASSEIFVISTVSLILPPMRVA